VNQVIESTPPSLPDGQVDELSSDVDGRQRFPSIVKAVKTVVPFPGGACLMDAPIGRLVISIQHSQVRPLKHKVASTGTGTHGPFPLKNLNADTFSGKVPLCQLFL
jgi:hypothetical protein